MRYVDKWAFFPPLRTHAREDNVGRTALQMGAAPLDLGGLVVELRPQFNLQRRRPEISR